jgi:hypothetical protein
VGEKMQEAESGVRFEEMQVTVQDSEFDRESCEGRVNVIEGVAVIAEATVIEKVYEDKA